MNPVPIILVADTTFFRRNEGVCIFYATNIKKVIARSIVKSETSFEYRKLKLQIENLGFTIQAVVIDGRKGIKEVFRDIPIQMCQFHQLMILRRYLTMNPRLEAAKELKQICKNLCKIKENEFVVKFNNWNVKWYEFLKEKTFNENGKWFYTHKRLRSARRSLITNIPYLFTYQNYSKLNIPNTTNCVESINSKLKELTKIHRGFNIDLKCKIIDEILSK